MKTKNNSMTRTLPTDKNGNVYYGPKTVAAARAAITDMDAEPSKVISMLHAAGYDRVAATIEKEYEA